MFHQRIENGRQVEEPDPWLREGFPWEVERYEFAQTVKFGGHTTTYRDMSGKTRYRWADTRDVLAIPYDVPVPGYRNDIVNTLRLWSAAATDEFDLNEFNAGSYTDAVASKNEAENITMVLYPNAATETGQELRLRQQYFLASVAELMRLLIDDYMLDWDEAWDITRKTMAYTNHTLLPEALEMWPVSMFRRLLPRILAHVADPGRPRAHDTHGLPRPRRQLFRQRRRRAAFTVAAERFVPRLCGAVAGEIQQQDERRDPTALARRVQRRPG
jgi:starch phosphorylase